MSSGTTSQLDLRRLLKYLIASASFFFIGTVHGVIQVIPSVRAWLDSIGSPYGGPGHMIDPLAHAHINVVGGVVLLCMAVTYYMFTTISGRPLYSQRLVDHSFWWTTIGISCFYSTLLSFGILEGYYLLAHDAESMVRVHRLYGTIIAAVSTVMGMGFWIFFINIFMTVKRYFSQRHDV
jgi:cytochrome c oxidase cbb3-type subunit 1